MKYAIVFLIIAGISCQSPKSNLIASLKAQQKILSDSVGYYLLIQNQFNMKAGMLANKTNDTLKYYPLVDSTEKYFGKAKALSARITVIKDSINDLARIK